jgi:hypothetical protein
MVLDKATEHPNCHIFIDEFPAGEDGFTSEEVSQLDKKVSEKALLWIACRSEQDNPESVFMNTGETFNTSSSTFFGKNVKLMTLTLGFAGFLQKGCLKYRKLNGSLGDTYFQIFLTTTLVGFNTFKKTTPPGHIHIQFFGSTNIERSLSLANSPANSYFFFFSRFFNSKNEPSPTPDRKYSCLQS